MKNYFKELDTIKNALKSENQIKLDTLFQNNPNIIHTRDEEGQTLLSWLVQLEGDFVIPMIDYLIQQGADVNQKNSKYSDTALHKALNPKTLNEQVVQCLLEHGADPNFKNNHLLTPIGIIEMDNTIYGKNKKRTKCHQIIKAFMEKLHFEEIIKTEKKTNQKLKI